MTRKKSQHEVQQGGEPVFSERQWLLLGIVALGVVVTLLGTHRLFFHKPNVLLITIDTLRPERLGCYDPSRTTSPHLDEIARQGFVFERCYASSSWTLPSGMTIHTGLYPFRHGVEWVNKKLSPEVPTLAEILKARQYDTGAVESSLFLQSQFGFHRGFDQYQEQPISDHQAISSPMLTDRALEWLRAHPYRPFFFWIHYLDPHYDYLYHPEAQQFAANIPEAILKKPVSIFELIKIPYALSPEEFQYQNQLYEGEIFFTDLHVGRLVSLLKSMDRWDDTWVIVTSDHGEMLGEHGALGHTEWYYEQVLRVPLIIKPPRGLHQPVRIAEPCSIVDVVPTVLHALGVKFAPEQFDGHPVLPRSENQKKRTAPRGPLWARTNTPLVNFVARLGQPKIVLEPKTGTKRVFDLVRDASEEQDFSEDYQDVLPPFLEQVVSLLRKQPVSAPKSVVNSELLEQVKTLGYLGREQDKDRQ